MKMKNTDYCLYSILCTYILCKLFFKSINIYIKDLFTNLVKFHEVTICFSRRKRGGDKSESDAPSLQIMRRMTIERSEQLKKEILEMQQSFKYVYL